jgi:hypothetical protein
MLRDPVFIFDRNRHAGSQIDKLVLDQHLRAVK